MTTTDGSSGRSVFLVVSATVVALAAGLGAVIGTVGEGQAASMDLGVVAFAMTPLTMALFGVLATSAVLAVLFGLVQFASRFDTDQRDDRA